MNFIDTDIILVSYPRSGNTWLRFLMANMYFPHQEYEHDFKTIHKLMPALDSDEMNEWERVHPQFFKSHAKLHTDKYPRAIYMYRHVGDVLISFFHYFRKYHNYDDKIENFLAAMNYGQDWRISVNSWFKACENKPQRYQLLPYEALIDKPQLVMMILRHFVGVKTKIEINEVLEKSKFENLQRIENEKGLLRHTNPGIKFFRKGTIDQWKELPLHLQKKIIEKNESELKMLQYI